MVLSKKSAFNDKISTKVLKVLICILLMLLLYGVNNTSLFNSSLKPFGIGVVFSLLFLGFNGYILGGINFVMQLLTRLSWIGLLECINVFAVLIVLEYLVDKKGFGLKKWLVFLLSMLSQLVFVVFNVCDLQSLLSVFVSLTLSQFFLYSCMVFGDSILNRYSLKAINLDEKICGAVVLIIFSIGISGACVGVVNLGLLFLSLLVLICVYLTNYGMSLIISLLCGIGYSVVYVNPVYIFMFQIMALLAIAFKCNYRVLSALALIVGYIAFSIFFDMGFTIGGVVSTSIGAIVYIVIPSKVLVEIAGLFGDKSHYIIKNVIDRNKACVVNRIEELSKVFLDMNNVYRGMVKGALSRDGACSLIKEEVESKVCRNCDNYNSCFRVGTYISGCVDRVVETAFDKGKAMLIDIPEYMSMNCIGVSSMINSVNSLISAYTEYSATINNLDTSRILLADQLEGVSRLLKTLGDEVNVNINFDNKYTTLIKENLSYSDIVCYECIIYEKDINVKNILLIVKNNNINDKLIEKIVNKTLKRKFKIKSIETSEIKGAVNISLVSRPNYEVAFGSSVATKGGGYVSGDNHAFISIDDGKFMLTLSDGMGSGVQAESISALTIRLVENFYKAGFDNEIILNSINRLLGLNEQERFSTIDLSIIDGRNNTYDFIKLGSCATYLKRDCGDIEIIESSGLPIGVLENIKPHITKKLVSNMDMIIMISDGVSDIIGDEIIDVIRNEDTINPQTLSDIIIEYALSKNGGIAGDDMTVICARVFECV